MHAGNPVGGGSRWPRGILSRADGSYSVCYFVLCFDGISLSVVVLLKLDQYFISTSVT